MEASGSTELVTDLDRKRPWDVTEAEPTTVGDAHDLSVAALSQPPAYEDVSEITPSATTDKPDTVEVLNESSAALSTRFTAEQGRGLETNQSATADKAATVEVLNDSLESQLEAAPKTDQVLDMSGAESSKGLSESSEGPNAVELLNNSSELQLETAPVTDQVLDVPKAGSSEGPSESSGRPVGIEKGEEVPESPETNTESSEEVLSETADPADPAAEKVWSVDQDQRGSIRKHSRRGSIGQNVKQAIPQTKQEPQSKPAVKPRQRSKFMRSKKGSLFKAKMMFGFGKMGRSKKVHLG